MTHQVQTSATGALQQLVACERYRDRFSTGLPMSGCLRRQLERQPGAKAGTAGPPKFPACVVCPQGAEVAARAAAAGISRGTCGTCGGALVGVTTCEACTSRAMEKTKPAKGFLPATGAPPQERIWAKGGVPDVPIGPAPSAVVGFGAAGSKCVIPGCTVRLKKAHVSGVCGTCRANGERGPMASVAEAAAAAVERVREAAPRVAPAVVNQEPARPAERTETMPGKTCSKCGKTLRADNTAGICGDQTGCRARVAAKAGKPALPPRPAKAIEKPRRAVRAGKDEALPLDLDGLSAWEAPQLRVLKARVDDVLRAKLQALDAERQAIKDALGEAA